MKVIFLIFLLVMELFSSIIEGKISEVDNKKNIAKVVVDQVEIGVTGYIVHHISNTHDSVLKSCEVVAYDEQTNIATVVMKDFNLFQNDALPRGKWQVTEGDSVALAFGYSRSLLIGPNEELYYRIKNAIETEWVHPDLFATMLSREGHPTPLQKDFQTFSNDMSIGLVFIYLDQKLYTVDMQSFRILNINEAPLEQSELKLPFYSRVEKIDANWFGEGSSRLQSYEPHYYKLLVKNNKQNKTLYEVVSQSENKNINALTKQFEIGE